MKTTDTVTIDGRAHTVKERRAPAPATKAAAPHLSEILFLEGRRGGGLIRPVFSRSGHYRRRGAVKMAYLFASGEIRIVI